ncbi:MAG: hypothetical protein ACREON_05785 [Gemmatimonadaceae bacterium]
MASPELFARRRSLTAAAVRVGLAALIALSCSRDDGGPNARGAGLRSVTLPAAQSAQAYGEAMRGAFDVGPGLVLLLDPAILPRARDGEPPGLIPRDVVREMRDIRVIQGTCDPRGRSEKAAPICAADAAGYIVRVSELYGVAPDSVQLYVTAERYRPASDTSGFQPPLQLEQRYTLARRGDSWRVARKERLLE